VILLIDNYDSFVFNVARYLEEIGGAVTTVRNDAISVDGVEALGAEAIVISPGPCSPTEAGVSLAVIERFSGRVPILGVCLGHQAIGHAFGGTVARARRPLHGRASEIRHSGGGVFRGLPSPFAAGRYHSLIVEPTAELERQVSVEAWSEEGEIMALAHRRHPTFGVQFHPESVLTRHGHAIFRNFLDHARGWRAAAAAA